MLPCVTFAGRSVEEEGVKGRTGKFGLQLWAWVWERKGAEGRPPACMDPGFRSACIAEGNISLVAPGFRSGFARVRGYPMIGSMQGRMLRSCAGSSAKLNTRWCGGIS